MKITSQYYFLFKSKFALPVEACLAEHTHCQLARGASLGLLSFTARNFYYSSEHNISLGVSLTGGKYFSILPGASLSGCFGNFTVTRTKLNCKRCIYLTSVSRLWLHVSEGEDSTGFKNDEIQ